MSERLTETEPDEQVCPCPEHVADAPLLPGDDLCLHCQDAGCGDE